MVNEESTTLPTKKRSWRRLSRVLVFIVLLYVTSYFVDSFCGGYWTQPEMDGRDRYSFGLAMRTAILWQPRFGHEAIGNLNYLGVFFTPLIRFDRRFIHPTLYVGDEEVGRLPRSKVHPVWRDIYFTDFTAIASRNETAKVIECKLRLAGSNRIRTLTEIRIPRELLNALGASSPSNFTEKSFEDYEKYNKKNYIRWIGKLALRRDEDVTLIIPAQHPNDGTGTIRFYCELDEKSEIYSTIVSYAKLQSQLP